MPESFGTAWEQQLARLREIGRLRSLRTHVGPGFGSNDYLGFADDPELKALAIESLRSLPLSSSSSRLLPGFHSAHLEAEEVFANFVGAESALFFNSGYDANIALLTTLPTRHDLVLYDERSHASIYDGVHASLAKSRRFAHNSAGDLRKKLKEPHAGSIFVVLESVYSMDGDVAALAEIAEVAREAGAMLIVDEAHATGVLGKRGEGLVKEMVSRENVLGVHTCGKALGAAGAFVVGNRIVKEYLINKARPFIFTTALPPLVPMQIIHSIHKLEREGSELVARLRERATFVRNNLRQSLTRWTVPEGITPIISIIIGTDSDAVSASRSLEDEGFVIPAVRPPTVPEGTARLRMNVSLRHTEAELENAIAAICRAEGK